MAVYLALFSYDSVSDAVFHIRLQGSLLLTMEKKTHGKENAQSYAKSITTKNCPRNSTDGRIFRWKMALDPELYYIQKKLVSLIMCGGLMTCPTGGWKKVGQTRQR